MAATRSSLTLLSTLLISLAMAGCIPSQVVKPTKPSGITVMAGEGLVCYWQDDHAQIMTYILELERAAR